MALTRITKGVIKPNENYDTHNINSTGIITATAFSGPFTGVGNSSIQSGIITTTGIDLNGDLDVDGHTNLDNVSIAGVTTAAGAIDLNADLDVDGHTNLDNVSIAGVSTFTGDATFSGNVSIGGTLTYEDVTNIDSVGIVTARTGVVSPYADIDDWIDVGNHIQLGNAGIVTAKGADINGDIDVDGHTNLDNVSIAGVTTATGNIIANSKIGIGTNNPLGTLDIFNANADASNLNSLGAQINAAWIRIGDVDAAGKTFSNGLGTKLFNQGTAHWSYGMLGQDFLITNTSGDGNKLFPSNRTAPFIIKSDGKVGIGTDNPQAKLEIAGSTTNILGYSDGQVQIVGNNPIAFVSQSNLNPALNRWGFKLASQNDGDFSIYDYRHSSNRLLINSSGNVGIGTITNWSPYKLQVAGGLGIAESANTGQQAMSITNNSIQTLSIGVAYNALLLNKDGGNVAIGNASPQQLLHVWPDTANTTSAYVRVTAGDRNSNTGIDIGHDASGNGQVNVVSNGTLTFSTLNTPRIKIANNSAATAIGTNAAYNAMLTVRGDISGALLMLKATEDTNRFLVSGTDSNGCEVNLYDGAGGQKGILGVSGSEFFIKAPNNSAPLTFYTHNGSSLGERLRIDSTGRILVNGAADTNAFVGGDDLIIGNASSGTRTGMTLVSHSAQDGGVYFSRGTSSGSDYVKGQIVYNHPNDYMAFYVDSSIRALNIFDTGDISIGNNTKLSSFSSFRHINIGNNLIINAGTSAGGYVGFQNNAYLSAAGNWTRMHNDHTSSFGMDDGVFYFRNAGAGTGNISWQYLQTIEADGRVNFLTDNADITNPDIGGSCAGISLNKNTTGQIYACVDDAGGHYYKNWTMNLCRRNNAGDGPQLALDRSGWVKASIGGLSGSNTANGGPGQFAIWTHDYNSGSHVQKEQLRILNNGTIYVGRDGVGGRLYTDGSSGSLWLQSGNGRQSFRIYDMASGQSHTTHLDATGQLGIGIAPSDKLHIYHASNDPFIKIQRDTSSNVSCGGIKFASGAGSGIFATLGSRVTSNSGEKGCVYFQTQDGSNTREALRVVGASGGLGSRLTSQGNSVCVFGSDQTMGGQFKDGAPNYNSVYSYADGDYQQTNNGAYGGSFTVQGDSDKWYPVSFSLPQKFPHILTVGKYVHNYGSWDGKLMIRAEISGTGYGAHNSHHRIKFHSWSARQFVGRIIFTSHNNAYLVLWLLGGGRGYHWGTIGGGTVGVSVRDDGGSHNLGPGNTSETYITSADTIDSGYEPNMNDSPSHQQTGFT